MYELSSPNPPPSPYLPPLNRPEPVAVMRKLLKKEEMREKVNEQMAALDGERGVVGMQRSMQ